MAATIEQGLILAIRDFEEKNQIVKIITKKEIFSFIAVGTKKLSSKNRNAIQLGNIVEIEVFRARLKNKISRLKRAIILFQPDIQKVDTAKIILEMIKQLNKINQNANIEKLYKAIDHSYKYLGGHLNHHVLAFILARVLEPLGVKPVLNKCVICGRIKNIAHFSFWGGGFYCEKCSSKRSNVEYLKSIVKLFSNFEEYKNVDDEINFIILKNLKRFLNS